MRFNNWTPTEFATAHLLLCFPLCFYCFEDSRRAPVAEGFEDRGVLSSVPGGAKRTGSLC